MADIVFNRLVDVDKDEVTIIPSLAESWTASPDATVYTFKLYPTSAVWSDGVPATVDDVIFTIAWAARTRDAFKQARRRRVAQGQGRRRRQGDQEHPRRPQEDRRPQHRDHAQAAGLDVPAPHRRRRLLHPSRSTSSTDLTPAQAETCDFCLGVAGKTPGTGPYDFTKSISATGATFTAKTGYWKGKDGPIETIDLQDPGVQRLGRPAGGRRARPVIRVPPAEGPGLANVPGLKQLNVPGVGIFAINFNHRHRTDKQLRQAIAYAINRPETIEKVLGGLATLNYTIPPGLQGLRRHQQVRLRPGQGQGAPGGRQVGTSASRSGFSSSPRIRTSPSRHRRSSSTSRTSA